MARIDHAVISGTFSLDGQTFDVDNNVWVIGDDTECVVIDAPHKRVYSLDGLFTNCSRHQTPSPLPITRASLRPALAGSARE